MKQVVPSNATPGNALLAQRRSFHWQAVVVAVTCLLSFPARTQPGSPGKEVTSRYEPVIAEAAERFAIPPAWIRAVIDVESNGDARAVSPKGAIGLMQLKPKTYQTLRLRYALGADPYDVHDNIVAGAAYLREMYDRFGAAGFLAAYNAGPNRYRDHLETGRPLPLETSAYVVQLALRLEGSLPEPNLDNITQEPAWQDAALFATHLKDKPAEGETLFVSVSPSRPNDSPTSPSDALVPQRGALFVPRSRKTGTP